MAQVIVDPFEIIDVQHHQAERVALAHGPVPLGLQFFVKTPAVGDMSQAIGDGHGLELFIGLFQLLRSSLYPRLQRLIGLALNFQGVLLGLEPSLSLQGDAIGQSK